MRTYFAAILALSLLAPAPALARGQDAPQAKPVKDKEPNAVDVVATPVEDLGLRGDKIPPLLQIAVRDPYDLNGLRTCAQLSHAITELDALLGPDRDIPQDRAEKLSAGRVAQAAVGSFIPFRGLIREVSGANKRQRAVDDAVEAGTARRAFLKGYGQARGCAYPAREVTPAALAQLEAQAERDKAERDRSERDRAAGQKKR